MIHIIIFSFNRALQLDTLLNSIIENWESTDYKLSILYNTSSEEYQQGYERLKNKYSQFSFVKETQKKHYYQLKDYLSFFNWKKIIKYKHCRAQKSNFRVLLNQIIKETSSQYVMFLTDDSKFIEPVSISKELLLWIDENPSQHSISLRLGENINTPPNNIRKNKNVIEWNYYNNFAKKNWNYPFSVDAHIYNQAFIFSLLEKCIYTNPSTLEAHICDYVCKHKLLSIGKTFLKPLILSYPINMVQDIADNESLEISCEYLNKQFLDGYILDYPKQPSISTFQQYPKELLFIKGEEIIKYNIKRHQK